MTTENCKSLNSTNLKSYFSDSRTSGILDQNGKELTETSYERPLIVSADNGIYCVYLNEESDLLSGSTKTYFMADTDFNISMYMMGKNSSINILCGELPVNYENYEVKTYPDGTVRDAEVIGAASKKTNNTVYYTVTVIPAVGGTVTGGSAFGNNLPAGTQISLNAVADPGYYFRGWQKDREDPLISDNPYEFELTKNITLTPLFVQSALSKLEITEVQDKERTCGDTVSKDELTVTATYENDAKVEDFKEYTVVYGESAEALKKGRNEIWVTAEGINSDKYVIEQVKGKTVEPSMFEITNPNLVYDGTDKINLIKSAVSLKEDYRDKVGTPEYTVKQSDIAVETATEAGEYDIYARCAESDEYEEFSETKIGSVSIINAYVRRSSGGGESTVSFETNGGSKLASLTVLRNSVIKEPTAPVKEGYDFAGWYTDKELTAKYDFSAKVAKSFTLYAAWTEKDNSENRFILTIGKKDAQVFGKTVTNDVAPQIVKDRTMLPARFVAESLGAKVEWDAEKQLVTVTGKNEKNEDVTILITIGDEYATVNGENVKLDSPAFIENDRTYTPIRFITERIGANVEWDETEQKVIITKLPLIEEK